MNDDIQINPEGCPVCGFQEITALDNFGCTTFEICPSCGCEAGYAYGKTVSQTHLSKLREDWLIGKAGKWQSSTLTYDKEPKNWSAIGQLLYANLPIPPDYKQANKNIRDEIKILKNLSRKLWNDFDPISVISAENDDEYESYAPHTAKLILENADKYKINKYIEHVVFINIGMINFPKSKIERFANRLAEVTSNYN